MTAPIKALPLNDRQAQCIFRALLDYDRILRLSQLKDIPGGIVQEELNICREIQNRISLTHFYSEEEFPEPQHGDWADVA
jgi:hypothetical protein